MKLKSILVLVFIVLALNSCAPAIEYVQPDLPILQEFKVDSIGSIAYEVRKAPNE